jgi:hypothetical protein
VPGNVWNVAKVRGRDASSYPRARTWKAREKEKMASTNRRSFVI